MHGRILAFMAASLICATAIAQADEDDWQVSAKVLSCSPRILRPGHPVTLKLGPNHGAEMALHRTGTSDWYFLVVGGTPPEAKAPMTTEELKAAQRVMLAVNAKGALTLNGAESQTVLTKPGGYTLYLSDKLESEAGGNICAIAYRR